MLQSDGKNENDSLGRIKFARQLAGAFHSRNKNSTESIVVGINGIWGAGKTVFIGYLKNEITKLYHNHQEIIIHYTFKPWIFSGQADLQQSFLQELISLFPKEISKSKEYLKQLQKKLKRIAFVKDVNHELGILHTAGNGLLNLFIKDENISEIKKKVDRILTNQRVKLFIYIDDIDRLLPDEILELFRIVKLNCNFSNTTFILAYDKEIVEGLIGPKFNGYGSEYLEKIIQVDYSLPEISSSNIKAELLKTLKSIFSQHDIDFSIIENENSLLEKPYFISHFETLRDVKRYGNHLFLRLESVKKDLDIIDFLALEIIRTFHFDIFRKIYQRIFRNIYDLEFSGMGDTIPEINNDNDLKELCESLFSTEYRNKKSEGANKIDFILRYFVLSVGKDEVAGWEIERLFTEGNSREVLHFVNNQGRFDNLLRRISSEDFLPKVNVKEETLLNIIRTSNDFFNSNPIILNRNYLIITDYFCNLFRLVESKTNILNLILDFISNPNERRITSIIVIFDVFHKKGKINKYLREEMRMPIQNNKDEIVEGCKKILELYIMEMIFAIRDKRFIEFNNILYCLCTSYHQLYQEDYTSLIKEKIKEPNFLEFVIDRLQLNETSERFGNDILSIRYLIPNSLFEIFFKEVNKYKLKTVDNKLIEKINLLDSKIDKAIFKNDVILDRFISFDYLFGINN